MKKQLGTGIRISLLSLALTIILMVAQPVQAAQEFTFGCALPLTGFFSKAGEITRAAYTFWMETVNAKGGIGGKHKIKIIFYDDQSNPQLSAKLVEKLIVKDKVDLLLGGFGSSQVMAASAVSERHMHPMISGMASSNKLFDRGFKYYFSTLGKATEEVKGCADVFTAVSPKPKTVAIVGASIPFTSMACEGFKHYSEKNGFEVIHFELFPVKLQDYNTMLAKVKAKNPDVLLVGSHLAVSLRVMKALKEIDFNPKAVGFSYGPTMSAFVKGLKEDAEYVFGGSEWAANLDYEGPIFGKASEFNTAYHKRFGWYPDYGEAAVAGGAVVLQKVVEDLGLKPGLTQEDRVKIMEKLHEIDMMTFYGRIKFAPDGANMAHPPVAIQIQDGKVVTVFPSDVAETKPRYPMPSWSQR